MPANLQCMMRMLVIDRRIRQKPAPTIKDLMKEVESAIGVNYISQRCIVSDIFEMKFNPTLAIHAPIKVSRADKMVTYYYSDPEYTMIDAMKRIQNNLK